MIVIVEGFDNSGKSTLAAKISEELNLEVVHPGGPPKHVADVMLRMSEQELTFAMCNFVNFVYDRVTCISDMAYRQDPSYDKLFKFYQASLASEKNVLLVYCRPSDKQLMNFDNHINQAHDSDEIVKHAKDNSSIIISAYDTIIAKLLRNGLRVITYDFETDSDCVALCAIFQEIEKGLC